MATPRTGKQRGRHLSGPPIPARNTLQAGQQLNFTHGEPQESQDKYSYPSIDNFQSASQTSTPPHSTGLYRNSLSNIGDSSSLFSIHAPNDPTPPLKQDSVPFHFGTNEKSALGGFAFDLPSSQHRAPAFHFGAGKGTGSSPFAFQSSPPVNMVVEREPPKSASQAPGSPPRSKYPSQPEFGKPSPLHNRLQPNSNVFNIPNRSHPRPEHHRPAPPPTSHLQGAKDIGHKFVDPFRSQHPLRQGPDNGNSDAVEVPRHYNPPVYASYPKPPPTFSAVPTAAPYSGPSTTFSAVNTGAPAYTVPYAYPQLQPVIDLTKPQHSYEYDPALSDNRFGAPDPYQYVAAEKANEDIKALLEGAFEDEDDQSRTRARRRKAQAAIDGLAEKMNSLGVEQTEDQEREGQAEENEIDDGSVEGLKVKLLPHQVDGVEWMREKEIGLENDSKKKKVPKGGILADDMGLVGARQ